MAALHFHADPSLRMETQEGNDEEIAQKCVQIGTPREIYESPANTYIAARLGQPTINLLPTGILPDGGMPSDAKMIGARTEHFRVAKAANGGSHATVDWIEHLGDQNHLHVSVGGHKLVTVA